MRGFFITLFIKQNKWHKHSVLGHTMRVLYHVLKSRDFKFLIPALLHDIGKPFVAYQDEDDKIENTYSFTDHEEKSYQIIKNWPFISSWSKEIVRYHYLIRDMDKSYKEGNIQRHDEKLKIWNSLDEIMKEDLRTFLIYDDLGKGTLGKIKTL
ncbi:MAG: HD domain-containing protein [Sulfurospirillaceae bacterium]